MLGDLDKITRVKTAESLILEMLENGILKFLSLTPLLSNLAVSTTNTVNLMFNTIKMAEATN